MSVDRQQVDFSEKSVCGSLRTAEETPTVQIDAVQGLRTRSDVEIFTGTGGSVTVENTGSSKEFKCTSGTSLGGFGLVRTKRYNRYRPGQGAFIRFSARFPTPGVANSRIAAGGVNVGVELSFGYNGTDFGVLYRTAGELAKQRLTITTAASGSETATITLNGTEFTVDLTSGTTAHNAYEIASGSYTGYVAYQNGSTVIFIAQSVGVQSNTFSFSSNTAVGSFAEVNSGSAVNDTFVKQTEWNIDRLDGKGPSKMILDPSNGNVFQISYQCLGYGQIIYGIEEPGRGFFVPVHRIQYANSFESPSLLLPSLKIGWFAASLGSTGTDLQVYGASAAGFVDGPIIPFRNPESVSNSKTSIGTSFVPVISIRVRAEFGGDINVSQILMQNAFIAVEGTKPSRAQVILNPTLTGEPNWSYVNETESIVEKDTAATGITIGSSSTVLGTIAIGKSDGRSINLKSENVTVQRTDIITIAVAASSGSTDATASMDWIEE